MAGGSPRLGAVIITRRIAYRGCAAFVRALVVALESQGVTVVVRRDGPYVGRHREPRHMDDDVNATLVATGPVEAIDAAMTEFRQRLAKYAQISVEGEEPPLPTTRGRHRA